MMIDNQTFKMCLKKCNCSNIDNAKFENENKMKNNIEKYFDKLPNCHIINVNTKWYDEGDNLILVGYVTYDIAPVVIDECLYL